MENKTKVRIWHDCGEDDYLLLRDNEIAFLKWLFDYGYLKEEIHYTINPKDDFIEF